MSSACIKFNITKIILSKNVKLDCARRKKYFFDMNNITYGETIFYNQLFSPFSQKNKVIRSDNNNFDNKCNVNIKTE